MTTTPSWTIEGDYFEACNCESTCPCIFLVDPSHGECQLPLPGTSRTGTTGRPGWTA